MRKPIIISVIVIVAIFFILGGSFGEGGCQFNISTAKLSDAKICTSLTGNLCDQDNLVLPASTPMIYVTCMLKYAAANTKVKFSWMYYGDTKFEIDNVVLDTGDKVSDLELHSNLPCPDGGWPTGVYEVVIQIQTDNAKPLIKQFNIN
ncbi:MAG: hypothetical protein A2W90_17480 [Bacteroidetes bacterium GWF2_42_66]|nr:MAG: hypothetical protein A2W92_21280 [Bacteroidetes bacterium GWA2_42_15]OFX97685.1 MAG: hypothetical protein A2W89_19615 [Bacteroidetes bacterium GWE2_42_39]OFY46933.1 MAG: hypothetical protein A2W90_17480 [Bacteroidetes bacterium GWF2_42_66]HBL75702.1 hypothetical protein [Prolixibacteraceae bacterium]HCR91787.1 hypothetical protein [Prolixibacteraceae bacterium]